MRQSKLFIEVFPIKFYGILHGFKIQFILGEIRRKFPLEHGRYYTAMKEEGAIKRAKNDLKKVAGELNYKNAYGQMLMEYQLHGGEVAQ